MRLSSNHLNPIASGAIAPVNQVTGAVVPKQRLELIQVCRGIAALLVLLLHATELGMGKLNQPFLGNLFLFGGAGVNFFFVLSGFIIFLIHRSDIGKPDRLKPFILKRLIRVYPLYWCVTLAMLPAFFLVPSFGYGYERNLDSIVNSLLLLPQKQLPILTVGWSLSYEIFFYLVFALAIVLKPKLVRWLSVTWLGGTGLLFLLNAVGATEITNHLWIQLIFSLHNVEFTLGCLAAYLVSRLRIVYGNFFLVLGASLFVLLGLFSHPESHTAYIFVYGIPSTLIVVGAASLDLRKSIKVPRIFSYLGDASYSIYLIHYPCLSVGLKLVLAFSLFRWLGYFTTMSLLVVSSVAIGCLTYSYIEKPLVTFLREKLLSRQLQIS